MTDPMFPEDGSLADEPDRSEAVEGDPHEALAVVESGPMGAPLEAEPEQTGQFPASP